MSFAVITFYVASERVFIVVSVYFFNRFSPETFGYALVRSLSISFSIFSVSGHILSVFLELIPDVIPSQKWRMHMDLILNCHGDIGV